MVMACALFTLKYAIDTSGILPFFDGRESVNRMLFCINFYIPFFAACFFLYGCLFFSGFIGRGICLLMGFAGVVIAGYVLEDLFTINLCMYSAYVLVVSVAFAPPKNYYVTAFSIFSFIVFLFHPSFLGTAIGGLSFFVPPPEQIGSMLLYLSLLAFLMVSIRFLTLRYLTSEAAVDHLNYVGAKMLLFNHRLQEHVKNFGEEAVKKDRLRFTSDLHDSCGYVFTNIIAITDAAMSFPEITPQKTRELFSVIQGQAREGLHRTRETLHMIRNMQDPMSGSIDTVYQMKAIFEEVTGIKVEIESGNMRHDYGRMINTVLTRIIQEAFTNSIRHGQASRILIHFWEFPDQLTMTVTDNGIGARHIVKGIGLAGMEERLAAVGGTLEVSSPEDGGFRLRVAIPLVATDIKGVPT
jgi:signal transduction histidine kinase